MLMLFLIICNVYVVILNVIFYIGGKFLCCFFIGYWQDKIFIYGVGQCVGMFVCILFGKFLLVVVQCYFFFCELFGYLEYVVFIFVVLQQEMVSIIDCRVFIFFVDKVDRVGGFDLINYCIQCVQVVVDKSDINVVIVVIGVCFCFLVESFWQGVGKCYCFCFFVMIGNKYVGGFCGVGCLGQGDFFIIVVV